NIEAMDAHGGWIASSRDLVKLLCAVDGFNSKPDILSSGTIDVMTTASTNNRSYAKGWGVNSQAWWHTGSLDGTATFIGRTIGEYNWAILLNKRQIGATENQFWTDFDNLPWFCISQTSSFPNHDLMDLPTSNAGNISIPSVKADKINLSWSKGNGDKRMVVMNKFYPINDFPLDGSSYSANSAYGQGDQLGNNTYVVYNGTGNSVEVTNLDPKTKYYIRVFEYNENSNTGNYPLYKLCGGDEREVTTLNSTGFGNSLAGSSPVNIYPSPAKNQLLMEMPLGARDISYRIVSLEGAIVLEGRSNKSVESIAISDLQSGLYIVHIQFNDGSSVRKRFVKL
ncbi:MAG: T9SS type A sorting domain-containing protein, partial [Luteibaculum sp.]